MPKKKNVVRVTGPYAKLTGVEGVFRLAPEASVPVLHAELSDRVFHFNERMPSLITRANRIETSAVFEEAQQLYALAKQVSAKYGLVKPKKNTAKSYAPPDYSFPSYDEFEREVDKIVAEMEECPDELFDFFSQRGSMIYNAGSGGTILYQASQDPTTNSGTRRWVAKIFAALGLGDIWATILEILQGEWAWLMEELGQRVASRNWRGIRSSLASLFRVITSQPFRRKLVERLGVRAAARIIGKVAAKFVPFLGWAILIGSIVWAFAEEFI